jgi:hypothetical protein
MKVAALAAVALLVAGCTLGNDGGDASIEQAQLEGLVLQPEDLPSAFAVFDEGRQGITDRPVGERSDPTRFGRIDGWKSRYRRAGSQRTKGPLVIVSFADVFESADGAQDELEAIDEADFDAREHPNLGDDARAWESLQGTAGGVRYYLIAWREDNAIASVLTSGFEGKITFDDALELARKQAARVSRAASQS